MIFIANPGMCPDACVDNDFLAFPISIENQESSSTDNGISYLSKGTYTIKIVQGNNTSDGKLIIN